MENRQRKEVAMCFSSSVYMIAFTFNISCKLFITFLLGNSTYSHTLLIIDGINCYC